MVLVGTKGIKACRNVGQVVVTNAVIASTTAVGGVTDGLVSCGPGCVGADWIYIRENDIRAGCIFFKVIVLAVQTKRDRVVRIQRFNQIVGFFGSIQRINLSICKTNCQWLNKDMRARYSYLAHLPYTTAIAFASFSGD